MKRYVAVIDLGKANSKVALVDTITATEIEVVSQPAAIRTDTLYPSLDHGAIHGFIIRSLFALSTRYSIEAITVTTHGATVALVDASGQLVLPVLDYEFRGLNFERSDYEQHRPPFTETGSPALPDGLNAGAQLYWQQANFPEQFINVHAVLTWPQYWVSVLTGKQHNDVSSLGAHTDLYCPSLKTYSSLVQNQDWESLMPDTRLSGQLSGTLLPQIAQQTNLPVTTAVHTGIHDSNASLVPHLLTHEEPFTVISTGTWLIAMAVGGAPVKLDEKRDTLLNVDARGQAVPSARFMGGRERELLNISRLATDAGMDKLLANDASPALLLPSVVSGTGPYPQSASEWRGEAIPDDDDLRACAFALYLALMANECLQLIGSKGPIYVEGPLAHDTHFTQMLAIASKRTVKLSASKTGTSVGAAMLIQAPRAMPVYTEVLVADERGAQLLRYASLWQQNLAEHTGG